MAEYTELDILENLAKKKLKAKAGGKFIKAIPAILSVLLPLCLVFGVVLLIVVSFSDIKEIDIGSGISEYGEQEIPAEYLPIYFAAEEIYNVPWNLLAAIHKVETNFSTNVAVSYAGAVGHMQFMPFTWVGWRYPFWEVHDLDLINPDVILKYGGYGTDANGDGRADPWDVEDAIHSAAKYLAANGAADGDYQSAVYAYNHAQWYVDEVISLARQYAVSGTITITGEYTGNEVADAGLKWIGNSTYVFGGGRTDADVKNGIFDCSSFVHWCFLQSGVELGDRGSCTTETLNKMGTKVSIEDAVAGDIIFFDTYQVDGHVMIYIGDGKAIGCQTSKGVEIVEITSVYWASVFKGHVRRI